MITSCAALLSSGFGSGYVRVAPGTFGSLAAVFFWLLLSWLGVLSSSSHQSLLAMGVVVAGLLATRISLDEEGGEDPQWIVIDEWAGVCIALIGADPRNLLGVLGALVMFRIFDIVKPGPVSWAEDLPGAWGIMADDVIAGVCALAGMSALRCW